MFSVQQLCLRNQKSLHGIMQPRRTIWRKTTFFVSLGTISFKVKSFSTYVKRDNCWRYSVSKLCELLHNLENGHAQMLVNTIFALKFIAGGIMYQSCEIAQT